MTTATAEQQSEFRTVPLRDLVPGPNYRRHADPKAFEDLVASVRTHGVLEPLLVRPHNGKLEVVAGRRRLAAAKDAKLEVVAVRVTELTDAQAAEVAIVENLQREDTHPLDEAEGYARLLDTTARVEDVAARVGKTVAYVAARLSLRRLIPDVRKAYLEGRLEFSGARAIARLSDPGQRRVWEELGRFRGAIDTERIEDRIQHEILLALAGAPWKKDDATLVPKAGACTVCPKRTGAEPALFDDLRKGDHCTDPACFELKMLAHIKRAADQDHKTVLLRDGYSRGVDEKSWAGRKILSLREYGIGDAIEIKAKDRDCEHTVPGLIVTGERRGRRVHVCATKGCPVHGRTLERSEPSAGERTRRRKVHLQQEIERRRLTAIAGAVRAAGAKHKRPDWLEIVDLRAIAAFMARRAEQNVEQALCKLFAISLDKRAQFGAREAGMRKWIQAASVSELTAFALTAAAAADLLTLQWRGGQPSEITNALAKRFGVDLARIAKSVTAEQRAKGKKKTRPRVTTRQATKPRKEHAA